MPFSETVMASTRKHSSGELALHHTPSAITNHRLQVFSSSTHLHKYITCELLQSTLALTDMCIHYFLKSSVHPLGLEQASAEDGTLRYSDDVSQQ